VLRVRLILLTDILIVLITIVLYVLACDPLPPSPGKLKSWARAMIPTSPEPARPPSAAAEIDTESRAEPPKIWNEVAAKEVSKISSKREPLANLPLYPAAKVHHELS